MNLPPSVQRLATVDYCDGLGIAVGSHAVSFVHSAKRFFQVGLKETRTVPLPATAADHLPAIRHALDDFLADIETLPDQTVLCLPRTQASVSRLVVPEAARGSLEQVVRYEVERLQPFREEDIYYDYVTTEEGGEERRLGIVIFCFSRQTVDPPGQPPGRAQPAPPERHPEQRRPGQPPCWPAARPCTASGSWPPRKTAVWS